jgi:hypothetical protein
MIQNMVYNIRIKCRLNEAWQTADALGVGRPVLSIVHSSKGAQPMTIYIVVSIISGILFGVLDGLINANPLAAKLFEVYKPIAKTSINIIAGMIIDLAYGFILAGLFILLKPSLPGDVGILKGVSFALMVWFFRVVMSVASQWMMFKVPSKALLYTLITQLGEMLILGILYGLVL